MRLRTQLSLAFLLLAVVPLTGLTLYSYAASQRAFRRAVEAEGGALAAELGERMDTVARVLSLRLSRMRARPHEAGSAFERARREALAAAEQAESRQILRSILAGTVRQKGEIPFVIDAEGRLYAPGPGEQAQLEKLPLRGSGAGAAAGDWVIVSRPHPDAGLTVGIARPVAEPLAEIRRTAVRNLGFGLGMVVVALLGILPLSRRMTSELALLTEGAERLARGDLDARVAVRSRDEIGRLAATFNRMGQELRAHQDRLLERERLRKELEMCRRIQEDLLPRAGLRVPFAEIEGISIPAREVGGDFFNYFALSADQAALLVGDVSGKGVPAALLMANLQATLRARLPLTGDLARLAAELDREIDASTPPEAYLTLFVGVLDGRERALRYVNAGHNPPYLLHPRLGLEALESTGRPLGLLPGGPYEQRSVALAEGDALFLFTDGLVDAENEAGEPFGQKRLEALLLRERGIGPAELMARVDQAARGFRGSIEPADDATMVVLRVS
jgi:serine phosphatase RsbU (regulator of sigma subunit)